MMSDRAREDVRTPAEIRIDQAIGLQVRQIRIRQGLTQQALADRIGITYQQVHKYERAINRISVSRAISICKALGVPLAELVNPAINPENPLPAHYDRTELELAKAFNALTLEDRRRILPVVRAAIVGLQRLPAEEAV
jgi:transcriptional regulator with XRE-family HTH domain